MRKKILVFTITFIFIISSIISMGDTYSETITAWFYDIKLSADGNLWNFSQKPFVYNGNIYISLHDVTRNLGKTLSLNPENQTYLLNSGIIVSDSSEGSTLSGLQYKVDRQNLEINNLRFQLAQKEAELTVLKDNVSYNNNNDEDIDDVLDELEELLEDEYNRYRDTRNMYFDRYTLSQLSSGNVYVRMYGTFSRTDNAWDDRDKNDFRDFIEEICEDVNRDVDEDIEVRVYDKNNYNVAEYLWDERDGDLEVEYEY